MIIKYEYIGSKHLVFIPENTRFDIVYQLFDEEGDEDYSVYLKIHGEPPIPLLEVDALCQGRPALPAHGVGALHEMVVDSMILYLLADRPIIDVDGILHAHLDTGVAADWLERGWLQPGDPLLEG